MQDIMLQQFAQRKGGGTGVNSDNDERDKSICSGFGIGGGVDNDIDHIRADSDVGSNMNVGEAGEARENQRRQSEATNEQKGFKTPMIDEEALDGFDMKRDEIKSIIMNPDLDSVLEQESKPVRDVLRANYGVVF